MIEFYGPDCHQKYETIMELITTLVIMFRCINYGTWDSYLQRQKRYAQRFGPQVWALQ